MIANTILLLATLALATTAVAGDGGEAAADVEARQRVLSWVETASHFLRDVTDLVPSPDQALEDSHQTVADAAFFGLHVGTKPYRSTSSKPSPRDAAADLDDHATVEERQGQFLIRTIESVQRWWSGEALSPRKKATRPNRRSPAADHQLWASNDALSTLHLRAAEEYAELKRYGGAAAASAYPSDAIDAPRFTDGYYNTGDDDEINAISDRSRRKLVSLLRWRRSQRDHRQPPNLGPDHVPHYAKEIAARLRGDVTDEPSARIQRRSFNAQQSQDYSTGSTYAYCQDGLTVYPSSVNFTCNTSSTRKANFTAAQVALQPPSVRSTCVPLSSRRACICPRDSIQGRTVYGDVVCYWRDVTCTTAPLDPPACPQGPASEPLGIDKCVTIQRRSIFQFSINVTCRWKWANPADYAFYGVTLVPDPPASEQFLVLNTTNTSQPIIKNLTGYRIAAFGTAREIMDDVFIYTAEPSTSVMPLTSVHPSVGQYSFYARPVNFNALSDRSQQQSIYLGEAPYEVGQITGDVPVTFTIDFSGVPDSFLTANRAYIEVGLRGGTAVLNPDQVMGAQWTVDFLDVVDPPVKNRNPSNVTTIIIAVTVSLGVTLIIGIIIGIYCYRKRADKAKEKEEDRLLDD